MEKVTGIVLNTVKYNDKKSIVNLYTREFGRISVAVASGSGKGSRLLRARLMPLAAVRAEVYVKAGREIQTLGETVPHCIWHNLYFDPAKSAVVIFLADFLNAILREAQADESLWDFILQWLSRLDAAEISGANWHIALMIGLLPHMGINPDIELADKGRGVWFDMREGTISPEPPLHQDLLSPADTRYLPLLMRMKSTNFHKFRFTAQQRRRILDALMHYYSVHYPGVANLKSLEVLAETFA